VTAGNTSTVGISAGSNTVGGTNAADTTTTPAALAVTGINAELLLVLAGIPLLAGLLLLSIIRRRTAPRVRKVQNS
jgi:LPXTG-motif cell wall-anchored protein